MRKFIRHLITQARQEISQGMQYHLTRPQTSFPFSAGYRAGLRRFAQRSAIQDVLATCLAASANSTHNQASGPLVPITFEVIMSKHVTTPDRPTDASSFGYRTAEIKRRPQSAVRAQYDVLAGIGLTR